jgi:osomolarity two-component system, sensor histidine kinase NIK1
MGGDLWVESEFGAGSQFYFTTKCKVGEWQTEHTKIKLGPQLHSRSLAFVNTARDTTVAIAAEQLGFEFSEVNSISEACKLPPRQIQYDAVLVDHIDIVQKLRDEAEHLRYIPIVLVTPEIPVLNLKYCLDHGTAEEYKVSPRCIKYNKVHSRFGLPRLHL